MRKIFWMSLLPAFLAFAHAVQADTPVPSATQAQEAVTQATAALDSAIDEEKLARQNLDKAQDSLSKNPKSAKAKLAVKAAQKALDAAQARKETAADDLLKKTELANALSQKKAASKAVIYPEGQFNAFLDQFGSAEKLDAYFFFMDPFESKNKTVILDAIFDGDNTPTGEAKFTIWRNYGKMRLVVSNLPGDEAIPKNKPVLLAGTITGFKKEVISDELVVITQLKLEGAYICKDSRCNTSHI